MNKKSIIFVVLISLFAISLSIFQYVREFRTDLVNAAYSSAKPANGHTWGEMECSSTLCLTGGNTGLGTSTPAYKLDVQGGQINASGGLCIAGDCKTSWSSMGGVWTTSSTNIYNSNTGNVGIGTTVPDAKLKIEDGGFAIGAASATSDTEGTRRSIQISTDTSYGGTYNNHTGSLIYSTMPGAWGTSRLEIRHSTDWSTFATAPDMVIGSNVGIGTASPSQKLEVNGNILSSGDVCNGGGKCLSSIFQTNVIAGANPVCPSGQTMIMKAYNGTWYTADNASITAWNKVTCGIQMTSDGTTLLYGSNHTQKNCNDAGGTVVSDGTYNFCKFSAASCPSADPVWTRYNNWSTTQSVSTYSQLDPCGSNVCSATTQRHDWSNISTETACASIDCWNHPVVCGTSCGYPRNNVQGYSGPVSATITQIGCY